MIKYALLLERDDEILDILKVVLRDIKHFQSTSVLQLYVLV